MIKIFDLIFAARPLLHLPIWSVYLVALAVAGDRPGLFDRFDALALLSLSAVAAGAFFINQIYDLDTDRVNRKLGFLQRRLVSQGQMETGYLIATLAGLVVAWFVSGLFLTLVALQAVLGFSYSAPPMRLKDRPLAGLLANGISFGLLIPLSAAAVRQEHLHDTDLLLAGFFFLAVASTHVLTTIPDRAGDADSGKRTVGVVLSVRSAQATALLLVVVSAIPAMLLGNVVLMGLSATAIIVIGVTLVHEQERLTLLAAKLPLALLTLFAGYRYPYYLLFIVALLFLTRIYYRQRFGQTYPKLA